MSTINVTNLSGRGGATPNLPDGANVTGVVTATSFDGSFILGIMACWYYFYGSNELAYGFAVAALLSPFVT